MELPASESGFGPHLSLNECCDRMRADLGSRAPSYITLKRWSASGLLEEAVDRQAGRRPQYDYTAVRRLTGRLMGGRFSALAPVEPGGPNTSLAASGQISTQPAEHEVPAARDAAPGPAAQDSVEQLLARLIEMQEGQAAAIAELRETVAPVLEGMSRLAGAVDQLDAVRKMLMRTSDAEVTAARQRVEAAQKEIARLSELANPVSQGRTLGLLNRVEELLRAQSIR